MINKILIIGARQKDQEALEKILEVVIEEGGELFFAASLEEARLIFEKEMPQLVFLEASLAMNQQLFKNTSVVLMGTPGGITLPPKQEEILNFCKQVLDLSHVSPKMPPM